MVTADNYMFRPIRLYTQWKGLGTVRYTM